MKLKYHDKVITLVNCKSFRSRFKGFMFEKNINEALLFEHCNSIHTFFMKEKIDVIFCSSDNIILYYYRNVAPGKVIWPKRGVKKVYETPAGYFDIRLYDKLEVK